MVVWLFSKGTWRIYKQNLEHKMYQNSTSSKFLSGSPRVQAIIWEKSAQMQVVLTSIVNLQNQLTLSLLQLHLMGCRMDISSSGHPLSMEEVNTLFPQSTHTLNQGWASLLSIQEGYIPLPFDWSRRFSLLILDEHQLRVIATDGYLVHVSTDYIMIKSGERYLFCKQKTVLNFSILEKQTFGSEVKCYQ